MEESQDVENPTDSHSDLSKHDLTADGAVSESQDVETKLTVDVNIPSVHINYKYSKRFEENPNFSEWILPDESNPTRAKCRFCQGRSLVAYKFNLDQHSKSKKHLQNMKLSIEGDKNNVVIKKEQCQKTDKETCRTCLAKCYPKAMTSLFNLEQTSGRSYNRMMSSIIGFEAVEDDKLPSRLCRDCKEALMKAYNFRMQAKRANDILQSNSLSADDQRDDDDVEARTEFLDYEPLDNWDAYEDLTETKPEVSHECTTCLKKFPTLQKLNLHTRSCKESKGSVRFAPHVCSTCDSTFSTLELLKSHANTCQEKSVKSESAARTNQCRLCLKSFDNALLLLHHVRTTHRNILNNKDNKQGNKPIKKDKSYRWNVRKISRNSLMNQCHIPVRNIVTKEKDEKPEQGKKARCGMCSSLFATETELEEHCREHGGIENIRHLCHIPVRNIGPKEEDKKPEPVKRARCGVCSSLFANDKELDDHCREHGATEVIMCGLCERVYLKYSQFKRHFTVHHPEMDIINQTENTESIVEIKDAAAMEQVLRHVRLTSIGDLITANLPPSDDPVEIEAYVQVCGLCGCVILSPEDLKLHNQTEHPDYAMRCYFCAMLFTNETLLRQHRYRCKTLEMQLECLKCGQRFYRQHGLFRHVANRHPELFGDFCRRVESVKDYLCGTCGKAFHLKAQLNNHVKSCGPDIVVECDICHKSFKRKHLLERHMESMHNPKGRVKSFLCAMCGKAFHRNIQLVVHVRTHTGDFPYKCSYCEKGFPTRHAWRYHERRHTGDSPCVCTVCGKRFIRNSSLVRHLMIHTGERPYKCDECGAGFIQKQCLVAHLRKHYSIEPSLNLDPEPFKKTDTSVWDAKSESLLTGRIKYERAVASPKMVEVEEMKVYSRPKKRKRHHGHGGRSLPRIVD